MFYTRWLSLTFYNLISLKHSFVSYDCCNDLKPVLIRAKAFLLFGLKVVRNTKLLLSGFAFEALKSSIGILVTFWISSWIKFCGYSWENKTFWSSFRRFFLTSLFSTMVQILLASVFLYYLGWQELNGTHLWVSVFVIKNVDPNVIVLRIFVYHDIKKW